MKLLAKFNLILLVIFGVGGVAIAVVAHNILIGNARREVLDEAQLMLASTRSVRDYTSNDLSPLLTQVPKHRVRFLAETVPAFGATATFHTLQKHYPDYSYKEATLNPTNLEDRASDWESDVIHNLRDHPEIRQTEGERETPSGRSLYLANPIVATADCLECHSTPSAAPQAMLTVYGPANGFGWKSNEIVGAQIISVPMSVTIDRANGAFQRLLLFLVLILLAAIAALDAGVFWFVVRPLKLVSATADRVSRGEKGIPPLAVRGNDEVATVTQSFNRMQVSLAKAFAMLDED